MQNHASLKTLLTREDSSEGETICHVGLLWLACVCVPPVAVYLKQGVRKTLMVNMLLTLFWIPGVVHAAFVLKAANQDEQA